MGVEGHLYLGRPLGGEGQEAGRFGRGALQQKRVLRNDGPRPFYGRGFYVQHVTPEAARRRIDSEFPRRKIGL